MINLRKPRLSTVCLVLVLSTALAVGAAYAQPRAPAFGKPGEPIHALKLAQGHGRQPAGELRSEAIQSGFAEELLRARADLALR